MTFNEINLVALAATINTINVIHVQKAIRKMDQQAPGLKQGQMRIPEPSGVCLCGQKMHSQVAVHVFGKFMLLCIRS